MTNSFAKSPRLSCCQRITQIKAVFRLNKSEKVNAKAKIFLDVGFLFYDLFRLFFDFILLSLPFSLGVNRP